MIRFNRPKIIPLLFFVCGFGLCTALGTWQVARLQWKQGLMNEIAAANAQAPLSALPSDEAALTVLAFRRATLKGIWLSEIEFNIVPRYFKGTLGYWLITPLKLADGSIVLVNRGWVPVKKKEMASRPETIVRGKATVTGLVRVGRERSYFTPPNQPERNLWFGRDIDQMAANAKLTRVIPAMLDVVGTQDVDHLPVPSDGIIRLRNDHLSYILTWYGIALGILVIFLLYHRKR